MEPIMRARLLMAALCFLLNFANCNKVLWNASQAVPANHRTNITEDVPRTLLNESQTQAMRAGHSLPFSVDFVEQPDQFEIGQRFFMPARYISTHSMGHARKDDRQRWSIAVDSASREPTQMSPANRLAPQADNGSVSLITFDDDDSESKYSISTVAASRAAVNQSHGEIPDQPMPGEQLERPREQVESELERSLAEQRQLIELLGRRMDASKNADQVPGVDGVSPPASRLSWSKKRDKFVPLRQTHGFIRAQVPANHVVRHPNFKRHKQHLPVIKSNMNQRPKMFEIREPHGGGSPFPPAAAAAGPLTAEPMAAQAVGSRKWHPKDDTELARDSRNSLGTPRALMRPESKIQPQYYFTLAQQSGDSSATDIGVARPVKLGSRLTGEVKPTRDEFNLSEDEGNENSADAPVIEWASAQAASEPDYDEANGSHHLGLGSVSAFTNFEPYQHQVFSSPMLDYTGRDVGGKAGQRAVSFSPHMRKYAAKARETYLPFDSHRAAHTRPRLHASMSESQMPLQRFNNYHDRHTYEVSPRLVPSASHKVIHIHTKEKKGHGKYLWPILGGGLTMLMGFLIISNLLLSIPLLAMGASSLFSGQGGYHTQQLVPVYNLSALARPPAGRRRKRWAIAEMARQRDKFKFASMIRRVMATFVIRNKCKAPGFLSTM